ncbi:hypothetical protein NBRGN_078_00110 [Nocardia brasiliensis NBRC 14402]|uniref:hypothetical protein n=1 Tax=Nocardia brasiliensis TaxID=37326 RepID=UPI00031D535A|nr:hypothetical protein [Nocardia brasiliensis]GAJ84649.1 hypothetical protein NBRGN_078_00110 [Nocardia brasiliensis NBRC 14402]SUB48188.1 Uncharacterised protein [Nocardia brasiliensis]
MDRPEMGSRPDNDYGRGPQMMRRGGPDQPSGPDDRYQGAYSDWMDRLPEPEPEPAYEPGYQSGYFEDEFSGLIDRSRGRRSAKRWLIPALGVVVAGALAAVAFVVFGGNSAPDTAAAPTQTLVPAAAPGAPCEAERVGNRIKGNDPGGFDSGPAAIFAFQHAYYVARSGAEVRAATTPDAAVESAEAIQRGIDTIPVGTTYCVAITPGAFAGQYMVVVTENRPGRTPVTYNPQLVTTTKDGARTLISAISPGQ